MKTAVWYGLALAFVCAARGQAPAQSEPPLRGRPPRFSHIVGHFTMTARVEPAEVAVEEPLTLRLTIEATGDVKEPPKRKLLKVMPDDFDQDFYVEAAPELDRVDAENGPWVFAYRLRPKHEGVTEIGGLSLSYYAPGRGYQTSLADALPISVKPRVAPPLPSELAVLLAPTSFYELEPTELRPPPDRFRVLTLSGILLVPPLIAFLIVMVWRRLSPCEETQAKYQQGRAARRALRQLRDVSSGAAPPWEIVRDYLCERLGYRAMEPTPAEVRQFLRRRGVAKQLCQECEEFFQGCDAVRFVTVAEEPHSLRARAVRLIDTLEADQCAS